MKKITITISMILYFTGAFSQILKKNSAYIELGGNAVFYSLNFDRLIPLGEKIKLVPRVGVMYLPLTNIKSNNTFGNFNLPFELNALWGKNLNSKNFPELGIGYNLISFKDGYTVDGNGNFIENRTKFAKVATVRAGFRHQKPEGGLMYRIGLLVPLSQDEYSESRVGDDIFYRIYGGFSLGWSF